MNDTFTDYGEAYAEAVKWVKRTGLSVGIEKLRPYGGAEVMKVRFLPKPENRYGYDATCQAVEPGEV